MRQIFTAILLTTGLAVASPKLIGHPEPLPEEQLSTPHKLFDKCNKISIVEWRGSVPTIGALRLINTTCNNVVDKFYPFAREAGFSATKYVTPTYSLALIPSGYRYRSLNDNFYRFRNRPLFCNKYGQVCQTGEALHLVGWTDHQHKIIFIGNNSLAPKFQTVLAHELFHVLSFESGVFEKHGSLIIEENLVRRFTYKLGYGDI